MMRFVVVACGALVLMALVIYSQMRPQAKYVSGLVEAEEIRLGSRVGGRVKGVLVNEGDQVTASDKLVEFEPYDLKEREQQVIAILHEREAALKKLTVGLRAEEIAQAKARFDQAAAQLSLTKEGPRKEEIEAAEGRVTAANSELRLAQAESDRLTGLFQRNAISKSEFDQATEKREVARAQVDVQENELKILQSGARAQEIEMALASVEDLRLAWELAKKGYRVEDIEQATAARDAAEAALAAIRRQEEELTIVAPVDGTVDSLDLQPGDLVAPNAPVMTMISRRNLWVRAFVPQQFLQLHLGQKLEVTFDSYPDETFPGEVTFISNQAEFTPSNVQTPDDRAKQVYRIRVQLDNQVDRIKPGMTANVWLASDGTRP